MKLILWLLGIWGLLYLIGFRTREELASGFITVVGYTVAFVMGSVVLMGILGWGLTFFIAFLILALWAGNI